MKIDKKYWFLLVFVLMFIAVVAIYIGNKPTNETILNEIENENQAILNP